MSGKAYWIQHNFSETYKNKTKKQKNRKKQNKVKPNPQRRSKLEGETEWGAGGRRQGGEAGWGVWGGTGDNWGLDTDILEQPNEFSAKGR